MDLPVALRVALSDEDLKAAVTIREGDAVNRFPMGMIPQRDARSGPPVCDADSPGRSSPPRFFDRAEACRVLLRLIQRTLPCPRVPFRSPDPYEAGYAPDWAEPLG